MQREGGEMLSNGYTLRCREREREMLIHTEMQREGERDAE